MPKKSREIIIKLNLNDQDVNIRSRALLRNLSTKNYKEIIAFTNILKYERSKRYNQHKALLPKEIQRVVEDQSKSQRPEI